MAEKSSPSPAVESTGTVASKEKWYRIDLSRTWKQPSVKGKPKQGNLYSRGGYLFTTEKPFHIVPESELVKFQITKPRRFARDPVIFELDSNLTATEVAAP